MKAKRSAKWQLFRDRDGQWRFRLKARNGKVVLSTGEGLHNKDDAMSTIQSIQKIIRENTEIPIEEKDHKPRGYNSSGTV